MKVANIGMARARWRWSIQLPGRGRSLARPGVKARMRKGKARPRPRDRKMARAVRGGAARAAARAAPMKGAGQGAATATASMPVKKLFWPARRAAMFWMPVISKAPARDRPAQKMIQAMMATKMGDWNWKPQPAWMPAARRVRSVAARASMAMRMPAV
jgi:hypothetical protein